MRKYPLCIVIVACLVSHVSTAASQEPLAEAVSTLNAVRAQVDRLDRQHPGAVWPGFAPSSVPVLYVLPDQGTLLGGWDGELPDGFRRVRGHPGLGWQPEAARGAASTGTTLEGRGTAQVVVHGVELGPLVGLTVHEAFHVHQAEVRREGRRFGRGENSFLVTQYPIFDTENEARFALEGRILAAALAAESDSMARALAQRFVAVREARQRKLDPELAEFEMLVELNEGLAQYAGIRAIRLLAEGAGPPLRAELMTEADAMLGDLERLIESGARSFRLRFYHSGPGQALLLDRLAAPEWKSELLEDDLTLQESLARASGYRAYETALRREARRRFDAEAVGAAAEESIEALRSRLATRVDSVLSRPGVRLLIEAKALGFVGLCGIDPQNLLQVDAGVLLHTRWFQPCVGSALQGQFTTPVVHDQNALTLEAVIGAPAEVELTVDGEPVALTDGLSLSGAEAVALDAPGATFRFSLADIEMEDGILTIRPRRG